MGTAAWVLEAHSPENRIQGECRAPGTGKDQDPYRSETTGLYALATMVHVLCEHHHIDQGSVEIACDGLSALNQCAKLDANPQPKAPHFDIIAATRAVMNRCPIKWTFRHIYGHQDKVKYNVLDR